MDDAPGPSPLPLRRVFVGAGLAALVIGVWVMESAGRFAWLLLVVGTAVLTAGLVGIAVHDD